MKTYKLNNIKISKQELQKLIRNNPELLEIDGKNWRGEYGDCYFIPTPEGIYKEDEAVTQDDAYYYDILEYFQTERQAKAYRDYKLAIGRVSRAIWEANGDWEPDWSDDYSGKINIIYCYKRGGLNYTYNCSTQIAATLPHIKSGEIAKQIIKDHEEDLMTIFNYKR